MYLSQEMCRPHLKVYPLALRVHSRQHDGHPARPLEPQHVGVVQDPGELLPLARPVLIQWLLLGDHLGCDKPSVDIKTKVTF